MVLGQKKQKARRIKVCLLPELPMEGDVDPELAVLVVEVVVCTVSCVSEGGSKDAAAYQRVLDLVGEVAPWFRYDGELQSPVDHQTRIQIETPVSMYIYS